MLWQVKPDSPRKGRDGRLIKYETPLGSRLRIDFAPRVLRRIKDPAWPLWITEGVKKADSAATLGLACIALTGVWCWQKDGDPLPDWQHVPLDGRAVFVAFDSDVMTNPKVRRALEELTDFLISRGADVRWVFLPEGSDGSKVGLDDYFAAGHSPDDALALAVRPDEAFPDPRAKVVAELRHAGWNVGPGVHKGKVEQELAMHQIEQWWRGPGRFFKLSGSAGTGKTERVASVAERLGLTVMEVGYAAPTGKAAWNLAGRLLGAGVGGAVSTLHSLLVKPVRPHCSSCPSVLREATPCHGVGRCGCAPLGWEDKHGLPPWKLLVVDEASMVDDEMFERIATKTSYRVLFVGDHGQLPPVKGELDLMAKPDVFMETSWRQREGSAILTVASMARRGKPIRLGQHGDDVVKALRRNHRIDWASKPDLMVLCFKNVVRVAMNQQARKALGCGPEPEPGDKVICLKNNHKAEVFNGMVGIIREIRRMDSKRYLATIWLPEAGTTYTGKISSAQFGRTGPLDDVKGVDLWDYAYCITVHKAQGSQADEVVLIDDYRDREWSTKPKPPTQEYYRWLYTGITRAAKHLTILA
ncbi:AAA family ATPase [Micromonospora sp. NPDC050686]|uniref:AAA family ATPase n=1 Tax=Micromonospora sp. NPDC050686 TaxID=3154631 RepID=UPI0033CA7A39